jgi:uncharacterized protein YecT (DUF1311 family)
MTFRCLPILLLPLLLAAPSGQAKTPAASARAGGPSRALAACLARGTSSLDSASCYGEEVARLQAEQATLLRDIRGRLARPGASGTDHASAAAWLDKAQSAWESYSEADCRLLDDVFGAGSAAGMAGADCEIRHATARNRELSRLQQDFLN